jgi:hypothetical protein
VAVGAAEEQLRLHLPLNQLETGAKRANRRLAVRRRLPSLTLTGLPVDPPP